MKSRRVAIAAALLFFREGEVMFEKFGKKFIQGAKAEILEPTTPGINWEKVIEAGCALLELGIFAFAMLGGRDCKGSYGRTVIVNNYIQK